MAETKKRVGPVKFLGQVRQEGRKVTWTPWRETAITTIMVLVMVAIMSTFFFVTDMVVSTALQFGLSVLEGI